VFLPEHRKIIFVGVREAESKADAASRLGGDAAKRVLRGVWWCRGGTF
jgi:hypothetical protein